MKKLFQIITLFSFLTSCEEPYDYDLNLSNRNFLVVEGLLTNRPGMNYVKLSKPLDENGIGASITGADVWIRISNGDSLALTESETLPGTYLPEAEFRATVNRIYQLNILFSGKSYTARAGMVPVLPIGPFSYSPDQSRPGYYVLNDPQLTNASFMRYEVSWTDTAEHRSVMHYYNLTSIDVNAFFKPSREILSFPAGAGVVRYKFSMTPDHERFVRSFLSETEWKGGWFDVLPGNLHTNLSEGAQGYFAVCSVVSDSSTIGD